MCRVRIIRGFLIIQTAFYRRAIGTCVPTHQVPLTYISNGPFRTRCVACFKCNKLSILCLFFLSVPLSLDHIELDAQIPAPFPSSQSQRHHQVAVLNFPHVRVQGNRVHRRDGVSKRKGNLYCDSDVVGDSINLWMYYNTSGG